MPCVQRQRCTEVTLLQDGDTPLLCASYPEHIEVVRQLLEVGADVTATNKVGVQDKLCSATMLTAGKMLHQGPLAYWEGQQGCMSDWKGRQGRKLTGRGNARGA